MTHDVRLLLSRAARTATRHFQERAAELELSVVQGQALIALSSQPGLALGVLAQTLSKDQASTSILIDKLMTLGLVRRETDPEDRRRAKLYVTEQAQPMVEHLDAARQDINRLVLDALGEEHSGELVMLLEELLSAVEDSEVNSPAADNKLGERAPSSSPMAPKDYPAL